jgi:hypothetical protein
MMNTSRPAAAVAAALLGRKPDLVVHAADLTTTAAALRNVLAASGGDLFEHDRKAVRVVAAADGGLPAIEPLSRDRVVVEAHRACRPVKMDYGKRKEVTLSNRVADLYLAMGGEWGLRPIYGTTTAPLLNGEGDVRLVEGYDAATGLWCHAMPALTLPERPTRDEAKAALALLRRTFRTFPFGDAKRHLDPALGVDVVDLEQPPGQDESAFLVSLVTACARSSLHVAPATSIRSPQLSGAGCGKGLLARAMFAIAFGAQPSAMAPGEQQEESEKRIAAALLAVQPAMLLDNFNSLTLRSNALASALTERPAHIRVLGLLRTIEVNSAAFVVVTGNALQISEDLARRFIDIVLDAGIEDPEHRPFPDGAERFLANVTARRAELLAAVIRIWRWGRQNGADLKRGKPLGGFETWADWCRDPLLTLDCRDPIERSADLKAADPRRAATAEIYQEWWNHHTNSPTKAADLHEEVRKLLDPSPKGPARQPVVARLRKLVGTRVAGFVLTVKRAVGKWGAASYVLETTEEPGAEADAADSGAQPDDPKSLPVCANCGKYGENGNPLHEHRTHDGRMVSLHAECIATYEAVHGPLSEDSVMIESDDGWSATL